MIFLKRCFSAVTLVLGLNLVMPAWVDAAPVCVSRDEVGMSGASGMQFPGGVGGTGAKTGGVGGTGIQSENGGVGGTGAPLQQRPGGTGGTGAVAVGVDGPLIDHSNGGVGGTGAPLQRPGGTGGTGIVGTITGFASVCVNGMEVHYGKDVPVSENGIPASSAHLAIGQVIALEAYPTKRGLQAGRISILHAYEGPLTALPNGSAPLRVMGQPVRLAPGARVAEGLRPGEPVRVSGLRNANGEVVASRIERAPGLREASAIGAVDRTGTLQGLKLGTRVAPAQEVLVRGQWSGRQLEVAQSRPDPSLPFAGHVHQAVIEGLVQSRQDRRLVVAGFNVTLGRETVIAGEQPGTLAVDQRVRVSGVFSGGREVRATRVEFQVERVDNSGRGRMERSSDQSADGSGSTSNGSNGSNNSGHGGRDASPRSESSGDSGADNHGSDRSDSGKSETVDTSGKSEHVDSVEKSENESNSGRSGKIEKDERPEKVEKVEKAEKVERPEKVEKVEKVERPEKVEKVEKVERPEKVEKVEKVERPEKVEKVEKVERPEKVETVERPEKVEKVELPEKVEKVERPEKVEVEKVEKTEKVEHPDRSGR
ncbi:DUF5666 domain-containing protein [Pseudomonas putida]|uniref:DUF5666 domain-containing protein n=1 Tax=Pseudomonas putida TaxID=303 RepID=UPI003D99D801